MAKTESDAGLQTPRRPVDTVSSEGAAAVYTVSVRELCEFGAKTGDLDFRFTPSPTAQEGVAGHRVVAARRAAKRDSYKAEMSVDGTFESLAVRGRADGFDARLQLLEEVKTYKGELAKMPANHTALHWAQAKVYGWLLCDKLNLTELRLALVYFDVSSQLETPFTQTFTADALRQNFEHLCRTFLDWSARELEHRRRRNESLLAMRFPYTAFRTGQRQLAENTYIAASRGRCLLAQAPTGIGKTVGTLFPLLKAMPASPLDKVFFLTAKRSGRQVALDALRALSQTESGAPLRVLELVSRERACEHPEKACHGDSCPLAKGFYDRLPGARYDAVEQGNMSRSTTRTTALAHGICPYYLQQELVRWADAVIGDYNHFFDDSAVLHALTRENNWRVGVLVDEAHNLVERARSMYSAECDSRGLAAALRTAPDVLHKPLRRVQRAWKALSDAQPEPYRVLDAVPDKFTDALRSATTAVSEFLAENQPVASAELIRFYFDALRFAALAESFGPHSIFDISVESERGGRAGGHGASTLAIRNVVPAEFLRPRFNSARSSVLFSATLSPMNFYTDMLGLPADSAWLDVESPFAAEQLRVRIVEHVSTRFAKRAQSLEPIAQVMAEQFESAPGNYLAFFSSFEYMQRACETFSARHPTVPVWSQMRDMDEGDRELFLARFVADGQGIAFAVLGGSFGEGIDLPGSRLIGAFVTTLGMPQFNPVNERMKQTMQSVFGAGHEYTYLYPGMRKVVQAAGRVIRTTEDRGHLVLIDPRFARADVQALMPGWWVVDGPVGHTPR